jgi:hypothetical protein
MQAGLVRRVVELFVRHPDEAAAKIINLARSVLPPALNRIATLQRCLTATVDFHQCLSRNADELHADAVTAAV